ncbi:hypothetical protein ACFWNR_24950 [Streptomyces virginiae]|uniref:hypothetical protein n=1 Tax=Streptomyces virginiae TaxID=1961 RepID=UPI00366750E8
MVSTARTSEIGIDAAGTHSQYTVDGLRQLLVSDRQELRRHFAREHPGHVCEGMCRGQPDHLPAKGTGSGRAPTRRSGCRP